MTGGARRAILRLIAARVPRDPARSGPEALHTAHTRRTGARQPKPAPTQLRRAAYAGQFYPSEPDVLASIVDALISQAQARPLPGRVIALLAPHAGYPFSGTVAATAYRQIQGYPIKRVVILAPDHHGMGDSLLLSDVAGYETPLGVVPVDRPLLMDLRQRLGAQARSAEAVEEAAEHALEVQLPFLQRCLRDFTLVPLLVPAAALGHAPALAQALAESLQAARDVEQTLLVASSDLSHYHPARTARQLDHAFLTLLARFEAERLRRAVTSARVEACGAGAVVVTLLAARALGATGVRVLAYANSGDVTGDHGRVVGYGAAALCAAGAPFD